MRKLRPRQTCKETVTGQCAEPWDGLDGPGHAGGAFPCPGHPMPGMQRGYLQAAWVWGWLWRVVTCFVSSSLGSQRPNTWSLHLGAYSTASFPHLTSLTTRCPPTAWLPTSHLSQGPSCGDSNKGQEPPFLAEGEYGGKAGR